MSPDLAEMENIAKGWIELHRLPEETAAREKKFWAYERLAELIQDDPEAAWSIIQVIRREGSDLILSNLAAGPLEDLLVAHGDRLIDRVERLAEHDAQFRKLLGATWQDSMAPNLWKRIKAVAGPSW